jgi:hypothetical protein
MHSTGYIRKIFGPKGNMMTRGYEFLKNRSAIVIYVERRTTQDMQHAWIY